MGFWSAGCGGRLPRSRGSKALSSVDGSPAIHATHHKASAMVAGLTTHICGGLRLLPNSFKGHQNMKHQIVYRNKVKNRCYKQIKLPKNNTVYYYIP